MGQASARARSKGLVKKYIYATNILCVKPIVTASLPLRIGTVGQFVCCIVRRNAQLLGCIEFYEVRHLGRPGLISGCVLLFLDRCERFYDVRRYLGSMYSEGNETERTQVRSSLPS